MDGCSEGFNLGQLMIFTSRSYNSITKWVVVHIWSLGTKCLSMHELATVSTQKKQSLVVTYIFWEVMVKVRYMGKR